MMKIDHHTFVFKIAEKRMNNDKSSLQRGPKVILPTKNEHLR